MKRRRFFPERFYFLEITVFFFYLHVCIFFFRPKRERKLPAHLKDGDFAISSKALGLNADSETATGKKKPTKNSVAEPNQASSAIEVPDEITDEILGESPKNVEDSRDAMEDQEPKG